MFLPVAVLIVVLIDAVADMTTTGIGLRFGMPETNGIPRWFFKKFGTVKGPVIYTPVEVLIIYGILSVAYNILLEPWGQETAGLLVLYMAIVLAGSVVVNNTTRLLLKWRRLRKTAGPVGPS